MGKITVTKREKAQRSSQAFSYWQRGAMSVNEAILNMLSQPHSQKVAKEGSLVFLANTPWQRKKAKSAN